MDNLRNHEPISRILGQNAGSFFSIGLVEFRVSKDPEGDGQDPGNSLCCDEIRCVVLYLSSLKLKRCYLATKKNKLTQNCNCLQILGKSPRKVSQKGAIEVGME
jgi:hypothetical protein